MLEQMWPHIKTAVDRTLMASLNPLFDSFKPGFLSVLRLSKCDLGEIAPVVSGVKVNTPRGVHADVDREIFVDLSLKVLGESDVRVEAGTGVIIQAKLKNLRMIGTIRLHLKPLINDWPCFGCKQVTSDDEANNIQGYQLMLCSAQLALCNIPINEVNRNKFCSSTHVNGLLETRSHLKR